MGWVGVNLFFVLSGFLITGILLDGKAAGDPLRHFYARRALRILPLYYGALALAVLVQPHLQPTDAQAVPRLVTHQGWLWAHASNLLIARSQLWGFLPGWAVHAWSLAIEEQFYVVWPVLVLMLSSARLRLVCVTFLVAAPLVRLAAWSIDPNPIATYVLLPYRADGLAMGACLAVAARDRLQWRVVKQLAPHVRWWAGGALLLLVVARPPLYETDWLMQVVGFSILAALFGACLVEAADATPGTLVHRILTGRSLRAFGRYSYGMYILHLAVGLALAKHGLTAGLIPRVLGSDIPGTLVVIAVCTAASFAAAWLTWHCWERPFLSLKRYVPYA